MIDVLKDDQGKVNFDLPAFRQALGSLRLLLKVGMGKEEEQMLKDSLRCVVCLNFIYMHVYMKLSQGKYTIIRKYN